MDKRKAYRFYTVLTLIHVLLDSAEDIIGKTISVAYFISLR